MQRIGMDEQTQHEIRPEGRTTLNVEFMLGLEEDPQNKTVYPFSLDSRREGSFC